MYNWLRICRSHCFFFLRRVRCSCPYRQATPRPPSAGLNHSRDLRDSSGAFRVQTGRDRASHEDISSPRGAQAIRDSRDLRDSRDSRDSKDSRGENTSPRGAHRTPASEAHQQHPLLAHQQHPHRSDPHQQHPHRSEAPHYVVSRPVPHPPPHSPAAALPPPAPSCQQPPPQAAALPSTRSASPPFSPRRGVTI